METIDAKRNATNYTGPATSISTRSLKCTNTAISHVRGQGGVIKAMNGVEKREVRGSQKHEHVLEGRSMSAILRQAPVTSRNAQTKNSFFSSS